jgi:hypothetical protein
VHEIASNNKTALPLTASAAAATATRFQLNADPAALITDTDRSKTVGNLLLQIMMMMPFHLWGVDREIHCRHVPPEPISH